MGNGSFKFLKNLLLLTGLIWARSETYGQKPLPGVTVRGFNGRAIISWINDYKSNVTNISIQRSYDSTRNFITIGSVLNPMNLENGYLDESPPYDRMYYRVFITFEGGKYDYSEVSRPDRSQTENASAMITYKWQVPKLPEKPVVIEKAPDKAVEKVHEKVQEKIPEKAREKPVTSLPVAKENNAPKKDSSKPQPVIAPVVREEESYPSLRVFTSKENNVIINLPDADSKKYSLRFYDETGKQVITIGQIRENYLILEKVNFIHSGWFSFDLYEGTMRVEKNKIFIPKDGKNGEIQKSSRN